MRPGLWLLLLVFCAVPAVSSAPARAQSDQFDIQLGKAPPPPLPPDRARIAAVERFLAARQAGSRDRSGRAGARARLAAKVDDAALFGPRGDALVAYDFHDQSIQSTGRGAFRVDVYLLFADKDGVVAESRNETLTFQAREEGYVCSSIRATGTIQWDQNGVAKSADSIGVEEALARAENVLHSWKDRQQWNAAYSVADVKKAEDGSVLVQCLRFTASRGRRGFDAKDSTLVLRKESTGGYRVDSN